MCLCVFVCVFLLGVSCFTCFVFELFSNRFLYCCLVFCVCLGMLYCLGGLCLVVLVGLGCCVLVICVFVFWGCIDYVCCVCCVVLFVSLVCACLFWLLLACSV